MANIFKGLVVLSLLMLAQPVFAGTSPEVAARTIKAGSPLMEVASSTSFAVVETLKDTVALQKSLGDYIRGEIIVKFKENRTNLRKPLGATNSSQFAARQNLDVKEYINRANLTVLKTKGKETTEQAIARLKADPDVEYVQPNYQYYPLDISTDDANRGVLWGLDNTGQPVNGVSGANDADIDAPEGWAISEATTSSSVIVAVIDSGVAYSHPDLADSMWAGTGCVDDNGAALGGCNHGYDFEDGDKTPLPTTSSHGTHVAATIAAAKGNGLGIIGVAPHAKIMAIKSSLTTTDIVKGISFAAQNEAKIINASWGGPNYDQVLKDSIASFPGLFIAAAGNGATNNESTHLYPSDYDLDNVISVTATDQHDALASFSDYGATSVDVGAPGVNIYSAVPQETSVLSESFDSTTPPGVPAHLTPTGDWGTYQLDDGTFWGNVLYGDVSHLPYSQTANSTITSSTYNLSGAGANIDFWVKCDTEYITDGWADYMQLEYSANGVDFSPATDPYFGEEFRWDESTLDVLNGDPLDSANGAVFHYERISIPTEYSTGNFKFRFRWVANGNADTGDGDGCLVDDITITKFSDGTDGAYDYGDGTSMAAPHVAGLAALIEGYSPGLTTAQVKNTILTTGDDLPTLSGKTVSGKRINAFNALNSLVPATLTISGTVKYYDGIKAIPGAVVTLSNASTSAVIATTTTSGTGTYQFTDVANGGDYTVSVSKDDNFASTGVSVSDLIAIKRHTLGSVFTDIYEQISADFNSSGSVTVSDLILLKKFTLLRVDGRPASSWKFYDSDATLDTGTYLTTGMTRNIFDATADSISQDFVGIKMGDVNNSWTSS